MKVESVVVKRCNASFIVAHLLLLILLMVMQLPNVRPAASPLAMYVVIALLELHYLRNLLFCPMKAKTTAVLLSVFWFVSILWLLFSSKLGLLHPVLFPLPENVWNVFATQYISLIEGVFSSLQLLTIGLVFGLTTAVVIGLLVAVKQDLSDVFFPIAQVLTPIPPVIYAPYLVALMPTFRSASALIIFLGIFWPNFLNTILRVRAMESKILNSAYALGLRGSALVFQILLPYVIPDVVAGLKVTLSTSIMLLLFAEMMGATSGMGYYINNYVHYANYTNVVAGIILVGIVVTLLNRLVSVIQKKTIKWKG